MDEREKSELLDRRFIHHGIVLVGNVAENKKALEEIAKEAEIGMAAFEIDWKKATAIRNGDFWNPIFEKALSGNNIIVLSSESGLPDFEAQQDFLNVLRTNIEQKESTSGQRINGFFVLAVRRLSMGREELGRIVQVEIS